VSCAPAGAGQGDAPAVQQGGDAAAAEASALRKVGTRLLPYLALLYFAAFIDRVNVGFAALQMHRDLGFSDRVYGLGAGIFFVGYCLFEVPSNLILHRVGGRRWLARIMISWSLIAGAMVFVRGEHGFYALRCLLGVAEAGFFPGVIYYLTYWVPARERARLVGRFIVAVPVSTALGGPISSAILRLDGVHGLAGWQWLFVLETVPSLALGILTWRYLPDAPRDARWLSPREREVLTRKLDAERAGAALLQGGNALRAVFGSRVLALALCYFGVELGMYGVIFWVPQIFAHVGVAPEHIGYAVAAPYALAAAAMIAWSRRSDQRMERAGHIAAASVVGCLGLVASACWADSPAWALVAISIGAAGTFSVLPIFWTLPAASLRGASAAGAIALINAIGNLGGFAGPFVIGWIKGSTGSFTGGLLAAAAGVLATGVMAWRIERGTDKPCAGAA
jgi:ACS family tartrate transporter-like MFS transporter